MRLVLTCRGSGAAVSAGPGRAPRSAHGDDQGGALKQVREARITVCSEVGSESVQRADKEAHDPKQVVQYDARDAGWYGSDAMRLAGLAGVRAGDGGIHARTSLSGNGLRAGKGVVGAGAAKPPPAVRAGTAFRGRGCDGRLRRKRVVFAHKQRGARALSALPRVEIRRAGRSTSRGMGPSLREPGNGRGCPNEQLLGSRGCHAGRAVRR